MDADTLRPVTDPFFATRPEGTGLGLGITRQLIELNGGDLRIHSSLGDGTTVSVTLPATNSANLRDNLQQQEQLTDEHQDALTDPDR